MRVSTIVLLFLALFSAAAQKKPADVQILETKAVRELTTISVDGKVRVTSDRPLRGLLIIFDFRSAEKEVVTSQKAVIDEDTLTAGREGAFHSEMADSARAVRYTVRAFDMHDRELRVANPGPYPVE
jgi:carotenoid cleavage dioxygenase-like enzyme